MHLKQEILELIKKTKSFYCDALQLSIALAALYNALAQIDIAHTKHITAEREKSQQN